MSGFFSIHRSIWDCTAFKPEPFTEREAWIWMISSASHKPHEQRVGAVIVNLDRGQLTASVRYMAQAWRWSKSRVHRHLTRLERLKMICSKTGTDSGTGVLVITICNYSQYQDMAGKAGQQEGQQRDSSGTNNNKGNKGNKVRDTKVSLDHPDPDFDRFWSLYPRKIGKGQALTAWRTAIRKIDPIVIIEGLQLHLADLTDKPAQFIPHPSTWLNGERWADELDQTGDPFWQTFTWDNSK